MTTRPAVVGITAHESLVGDPAGVEVLHHVTNVAYAKAVRKAGGVPVLLPMTSPADVELYLGAIDAVLVTGGDDVNPDRYEADAHPETRPADPARDEFEIALINAAIRDDRPLLCICRGIQVLNVAQGGSLQQHYDGHFDIPNYNQSVHDVMLEPGSTLAEVMGAACVSVNSLHHQALGDLAPSLRPVGYSDDGLVEGVEVDGCAFAIGVQWHPEMLRHRAEHLALFEGLVAAGQRCQARM